MLFAALSGSAVALWRLRLHAPRDEAERAVLRAKRQRAIGVLLGVITIYLIEGVAFALGAAAIATN